MSALLLQAPRSLLQSVVRQTAESGGKAGIMSALLPALQQRLPLQLLRDDITSAGLIETLVLEQLSETTELKPFRQLSQLLVAAVGCQLTTVDAQLVGRVTALPTPKRLTLHLVQVRRHRWTTVCCRCQRGLSWRGCSLSPPLALWWEDDRRCRYIVLYDAAA